MNIQEIRKQIDEIDDRIVELLKRRFALGVDIGKEKRQRGLDIADTEREKEILERLSAVYPDCADAILAIYGIIFQESRKRQI